jgi:hypothetical protein
MPDGPAPYPTGEVVLPSLPEIQREREGVRQQAHVSIVT